MTDKKLTDEEIVKALECCTNEGYPLGCKKCPYNDNDFNCNENLDADTLDLINRQKAEIERLQSILLSFTSEVETWSNKKGYDTTELSLIAILDEATNIKAEIKAEAYKEFAERLKKQMYQSSDWSHGEHPFVVEESDIDNTLDELVGEK